MKVLNIDDGDTINYHLPLIIGDLELCCHGDVTVWNNSCKANKTEWPVINGRFKSLVKLVPGKNVVCIEWGSELLTLTLFFHPLNLRRYVRPIYIICSDDDGFFQGPDDEDCSPKSAQERITLAAMLIQSFTAEKMSEHGFGKCTFQLECDQEIEPVCQVFRSKLTIEQAHCMSGDDLWTYFARELIEYDTASKDFCKWFCFMSFTRYIPPENFVPRTHGEILKSTKGHTALGGGGLALFGTGSLHTWARNIGEINHRFTDDRKIDRTKLMDDSAYRGVHWANYATGLGASLHELGHTFDLAHTPTGIMARGFDDINRVFTVQRSKQTSQSNSSSDSLPKIVTNSSVHKSGSDKRTINQNSEKQNSGNSNKKGCQSNTSHNSLNTPSKLYFKNPIKQPCSNGSTNTSPKPVVIKLETGFKPSKSSSAMTVSVRNYDGTEKHQMIRQEEGYEVVTEMLLSKEGKLLAKTCKHERTSSCSSASSTSAPQSPVRTLPQSPVRTLPQSPVRTLPQSPVRTLPQSPVRTLPQSRCTSQSPITTIPAKLPNSPEEPNRIPDIMYQDGGAHWYRSSAVLLNYHKWFNKSSPCQQRDLPSISGSKINAPCGLRLVELRKNPDGIIFHHWEFLHEPPPLTFTLKLSHIHNMPADTVNLIVLIEDNKGNILKRKMKVEDLPS